MSELGDANFEPEPELDACFAATVTGDMKEAQRRWESFVRRVFSKMVKAGSSVEWSKKT